MKNTIEKLWDMYESNYIAGNKPVTDKLSLDEVSELLPHLLYLIRQNEDGLECLKRDLTTLSERIYDTKMDFADDEIEEIKTALDTMSLEDLEQLKIDKTFICDWLFTDVEDNNLRVKLQSDLVNKAIYPTIIMHATWNKLLNNAIVMKQELEVLIKQIPKNI